MIQSNQSKKTPLTYREYVHDLVQGGWDILKPLDEYMSIDIEDQERESYRYWKSQTLPALSVGRIYTMGLRSRKSGMRGSLPT